LLDECGDLEANALDATRFFLDTVSVGLVIVANEDVLNAILGRAQRALHNRVGMKVHVPHATEADADDVLKSFGIIGGPAREYGRELALSELALRGLAAILQRAREVAVNRKCPLDFQLMRDVTRTLGLDD